MKNTTGQQTHEKNVQNLYPSWICKLKLYGGSISPWSECPLSRKQKPANAMKVQGKRTSIYCW